MTQPYQQFSPLNALAFVQQQGEMGRERGKENQLNQLASLAYGAAPEQRMELGSKIASLSPEAAQDQRKAWDANDERDQRELMGMARFIKAAPPEQQQNAYEKAIRPQLVARGMQAPRWTPETQGTILQTVDALAQMHQGANGGTIQSQKVSDDGYIINTYRDGRMEKTQQKVDRQMWLRDHPGMGAPELVGKDGSVQAVGGAQSDVGVPGQSIGGLDIARDAQQFSSLGIPVSSTLRSGDKNREVGGVANSYHLTGEAIDVAPQSAEQKQQAQQYWRSRGYQVIDEGDHLHIEPPQRGATTSRLGGQQQAFARPSAGQDAAATERAKLQAQQDFLPAELGMRTDAAIRQAEGTQVAKDRAERAGQAPKRIKQYEQALDASKNVEQSIDKALGMLGTFSTGFIGARSRGVEGSPAYNLASEIETVKANLGFDRLQQMRDNSPTGGALGAIAVQELVALQSTIANLDPNQSEDQIRANLGRVKEHYQRWQTAVQNALAEERSGSQTSTQVTGRSIVRTGTSNGRKVIQYSDGSVEYGN